MAAHNKRELFEQALQGKKVPVLTLDAKWYRLLDKLGREVAKEYEDRLNELLRRQGKLTTEIKDVKRLKKKLMNEMLPMVDEMYSGDAKMEKKIEEQKRLIDECNRKIEEGEDELLDIPAAIEKINHQLMQITMEYCYETMQTNTKEIGSLENWVKEIRVELKKRLIRKQELEQKNHDIYSYMHDIFGADVVDLFDIAYDPEEKHPTLSNGVKAEKKKDKT